MERQASVLLEVCVDSIQSAVNAEAGGANRLELCQALSEGGLTPSAGLLAVVKKAVSIPVFVLVRPRRGDFFYSDPEVEAMEIDIERLSEADGFVFGALKADGSVNESICRRLLAKSDGKPCVFHRAFDVSSGDAILVAKQIAALGFVRLLTSGRAKTAVEGIETIRKLLRESSGNLVIMPGSGVNPGNASIFASVGCEQVHASCKRPVGSAMVFRNECCAMGDEGEDEYTRFVTEGDIVKEIVNALR
ncbi:unnamed protein product [Notodromas monacha]|uniref:Copper homeostasis protein cutC homolog n=1 Tax=Notodromas monacha TaxID=399045 RepID=A0A7R9GGL5_9CRUS|nr:unnamed protein product [Notodromas monacha]CAG0921843.1 unnamed protein product [Notodromas monacha]